jgi:tetratricopeptide (TPR) repeat protein
LTSVLLAVLVAAGAARTYARNRVWRDSLSLWSSVVEEFPHSAQARLLLASAYADLGPAQYDRALEEIAVAEGLSPGAGDAHFARGKLYLRMGLQDRARAEFALALYIFGERAAQKGDIDEAAGYYRRALQADARYVGAMVRLAALQLRQGKPAEARALVEKALGIDPADREARGLLDEIKAAEQGEE